MKKVLDKIGINSAVLKWTAILLMLLNHICIGLTNFGVQNYFVNVANIYLTRGALVIFAFQISEGFHYTKDKFKYILTIFAFAIIAEIPSDLTITNTLFNLGYQNVLWTLGIGALALAGIEHYQRKPLISIVISIVAMCVALFAGSDASTIGVGLVIVFYYFREVKWQRLLFSALAFILLVIFFFWHGSTGSFSDIPDVVTNPGIWAAIIQECHGLAAWPLLLLYNGKKGKNINKWFFYGFYPAHLLLIYIVLSIIF